ncbi:hypothetical protein ASE66_00735 [Bosea sp. Root483D1]|uniref:hypothetical protein n=1 Tax=Bosea sp. Root483D1 TaxID=1736544 RepID=UPI00070FBEC4|nr:hypothetical protein [Bosea sp. Root483D1]KRE23832.1 hypothetical protein ASE66_00735 [Bosea sp. Root483D1]
MIRFRTIDPAQPEKPAPQPALAQSVASALAKPEPEGASAAPATPKGLTRKTPLRAKKMAEAVPLFEK